MEEKYPYLGVNTINDKQYVVLFLNEEQGVVVMNETDSETIRFGMLSEFDESVFEPLPQDQCVRLSN